MEKQYHLRLDESIMKQIKLTAALQDMTVKDYITKATAKQILKRFGDAHKNKWYQFSENSTSGFYEFYTNI